MSAATASYPPTAMVVSTPSAPSSAFARSVVAVTVAPYLPAATIFSAAALASARFPSSTSTSASSASDSAGNVRISRTRFRVNTTLPAPINAIFLGMAIKPPSSFNIQFDFPLDCSANRSRLLS